MTVKKGEESTISVIIPTKPFEDASKAIESLERVDYPSNKYEIILTKGYNPSAQRNRAVKIAKGEILYFIDNDSQVSPGNFEEIIGGYKDDKVSMVGGPVENSPQNTTLQKCFGLGLGSILGTFTTRYRFKSLGKNPRKATERELILANLSVKRSIFLKFSGFNETLYPNEENEFINRVLAKDYKALYVPSIKVYRKQRETIPKFFKQIFTYGKSRIDHFFFQPSFSQSIFLLPLLFCFYLVSLIFFHPLWYSIPVSVYLLAVVVNSLYLGVTHRKSMIISYMLMIFPIIHIAYGSGTFYGFIKNILLKDKKHQSKRSHQIDLRKIKELNI